MNQSLQLFNFKGNKFTVITIDNKAYWVAKEICEELDIKNHSDATNKLKEGTQKRKLSYEECLKIGLTDLQDLKIGVKGIVLLTEAGVFKLAFRSDKPTADDFTDWISEEVLPNIQKTGRYDIVEQQIMKIEDTIERDLKIAIYKLEDIMKSNPNDMLMILNYNSKKQELSTHLQNKKIDLIADKIDSIDTKIHKSTVLREGDMSPEAIAKKFNIFSVSGNPHNKFADNLARTLGFYINPEGNTGYSDDYISINLTSRGGVTVPTIKYSIKAVKEMEEYINDEGLCFENPPAYYKRKCKGGNVGDFNYARILFNDLEESIKVNKVTYNLYNSSQI